MYVCYMHVSMYVCRCVVFHVQKYMFAYDMLLYICIINVYVHVY